MRILMVAPGTRGDVTPMAGLGNSLQQHGLNVAIAANPEYESVVSQAGLEFRSLPGSMTSLVNPSKAEGAAKGTNLRGYMRELTNYMDSAASGTLAAADFNPDVIFANSVAPFAYDLAEALNVPAIGAHLQPVAASSAYPPVTLGLSRSLGSVGNKLLGSLMTASKAPYDGPCARVRGELGLAKRSRAASERLRNKANAPVLHGFSETVVPRPADWRTGLTLAGYWWPAEDQTWEPPQFLQDFLDDGPPPVFFGFGSANASDPTLLLDAARKAGVRAIFQGSGSIAEPDAISVGALPHEWLFPRMTAVVHHGGAGTTGAGLRAGVPTIAVPIFTDQPFWGARIAALGAGPTPIPFKKLTVDSLANALTEVKSTPSFRQSTQGIAQKLAAEDSTAPVVSLLQTLEGL